MDDRWGQITKGEHELAQILAVWKEELFQIVEAERLAHETAQHSEVVFQPVHRAPDYVGELQAARLKYGRDTALVLVERPSPDRPRRRAWLMVDVSLDVFGDDEGKYPDRS